MISEPVQVVITTVFTLLVITDIVGNTLVCAVIIKSQEMRLVENEYVSSKKQKSNGLLALILVMFRSEILSL